MHTTDPILKDWASSHRDALTNAALGQIEWVEQKLADARRYLNADDSAGLAANALMNTASNLALATQAASKLAQFDSTISFIQAIEAREEEDNHAADS